MRATLLAIHPGLAGSSRLPVLTHEGEQVRAAEIAVLLGAGACAAVATVLLDMGLRIPGNAIVRAVFPMALGLALAPRRMGGTVMGVGALGTAMAIQAASLGKFGLGAITGLLLIGPLLDLVLSRFRSGWRLYLGFALAGLGANAAAFAARFVAKSGGLERLGARSLVDWKPQAMVTYAVCGLLAGLISAAIWFRFSAAEQGSTRSEPTR